MNEKRAIARHREGQHDRIGGGAIDCTFRNVSNTGAALDVTSPIGIPDRFTLLWRARYAYALPSGENSGDSVRVRLGSGFMGNSHMIEPYLFAEQDGD
jgi:hypothetical protein